MLSKKHYKAIAEIIARRKEIEVSYQIDSEALVEELANYFKQDNPNFNINKFKKACAGTLFIP